MERERAELRLRITTLNTWHGLDPYRRGLMLPLQPLSEIRARYKEQLLRIRKDLDPGADLYLLQEANPWMPRLRYLSWKTGLRWAGCGVNEGLRLGPIGYPPLLDEGLGILYPASSRAARAASTRLSGQALQPRLPFGIPLSLQLAETRGALAVSFELSGLRIAAVNTHLHSGGGGPAAKARRAQEIRALLAWLAPLLDECDLAWVGGDFNCEPGSPELEPLLEQGFEETTLREGRRGTVVSWNPVENPLCLRSAQAAPEGSAFRAWDMSPHQFDQLHLRVNPRRAGTLSVVTATRRVFDRAPFLSDHFGVRCEARIQL